jgi:hypothetical protein
VSRQGRFVSIGLAAVLLAGCGSSAASPTPTTVVKVSPAATPAATPTVAPTATATSAPTAAPTATPIAPAATLTFNEMMLDAAGAPDSLARTFTFNSDGVGPVSVAVVKNKIQSDTTTLCVAVDGGAPVCSSGGLPTFSGQATTIQSAWTITAISATATMPVVDISMTWPTLHPNVGLAHGRLQGSSSPNVPEELNGFNVTFKPRAAGDLSLGSKWTVILTYVDVSLADATTLPWVNLDEQQFQGGGSGVQQVQYSHAVDPSKTYRVMLRDLAADNYRPDLSAGISFP